MSAFGSKDFIVTTDATLGAAAKLLHAGALTKTWFNMCCIKQACEITQTIIYLCGNKLDQNRKGHYNKPIQKEDGRASLRHQLQGREEFSLNELQLCAELLPIICFEYLVIVI